MPGTRLDPRNVVGTTMDFSCRGTEPAEWRGRTVRQVNKQPLNILV